MPQRVSPAPLSSPPRPPLTEGDMCAVEGAEGVLGLAPWPPSGFTVVAKHRALTANRARPSPRKRSGAIACSIGESRVRELHHHTLPHPPSHSTTPTITLYHTHHHTLPHPPSYSTTPTIILHTLPHPPSHSTTPSIILYHTQHHTLPHPPSHSTTPTITLYHTHHHTCVCPVVGHKWSSSPSAEHV
jgi:hypothetical protein